MIKAKVYITVKEEQKEQEMGNITLQKKIDGFDHNS